MALNEGERTCVMLIAMLAIASMIFWLVVGQRGEDVGPGSALDPVVDRALVDVELLGEFKSSGISCSVPQDQLANLGVGDPSLHSTSALFDRATWGYRTSDVLPCFAGGDRGDAGLGDAVAFGETPKGDAPINPMSDYEHRLSVELLSAASPPEFIETVSDVFRGRDAREIFEPVVGLDPVEVVDHVALRNGFDVSRPDEAMDSSVNLASTRSRESDLRVAVSRNGHLHNVPLLCSGGIRGSSDDSLSRHFVETLKADNVTPLGHVAPLVKNNNIPWH